MKIASITITSDRSKIIGDALRSVLGHVDAMVFVDLGINNATYNVINEVKKDKEVFYTKCSPTKTTADWRNLGLKMASLVGADYAIQLDTDERMIFPNDFRQQLEQNPHIEIFCSLHVQGHYSKERVFRLPVNGEFQGHVHETWTGDGACLMHGLFFDELIKSQETIDYNAKWMTNGLLQQAREDPTCHRWPFQLGLLYRAGNDPVKAITFFKAAKRLQAAPEMKAIDCYEIALCCIDLGHPIPALRVCIEGLQHHPGLAELSHLAGVCCMKLGKLQEALCWSNMAIANGLYAGTSFAKNRAGLREPYSLWEGPFEMQRDILKAMNAPEETIQDSINSYNEAKKMRSDYVASK